MPNTSFHNGPPITWFMMMIAICVINLGLALRAKVDGRKNWEFITHLIAAAVFAIIAIIILLAHLS